MFGFEYSRQQNCVSVAGPAGDNMLAESVSMEPRSLEPLIPALTPEPVPSTPMSTLTPATTCLLPTRSLRSSTIVWLRIILFIALYLLVIIVTVVGTIYYCNYSSVNIPHPAPLPQRLSTVRAVSNLTLEGILDGDYRPVRYNDTWRGSQLLYRSPVGDLMLYDANNNEIRLLMLHDYPGLRTSHTQHVSADGRHVMLEQLHTTVYPHSRLSAYELYVLKEHGEEPHYLTMVTKVMHDVLVRYACFGATGSTVIFAQNNNIYYWDLDTIDGQSTADILHETVRTVSVGGDSDNIYNGIADWSYETEILGQTQMLWPSPDGLKLAFLRLEMPNDVPKAYFSRDGSMPHYIAGKYENSHRFAMHYPKAGSKIPRPHVFVYNLQQQQQQSDQPLSEATAEPTQQQSDQPQAEPAVEPTLPIGTFSVPLMQGQIRDGTIVTAIKWVTARRLIIVWMNRGQRIASVQLCYWRTGDFDSVVCEKHLRLEMLSGWLLLQAIHYDPGTERLATVHQVQRRMSFKHTHEKLKMHVALFPRNPTGHNLDVRMMVLNDGDFNAERIVYWATKRQWLFFLGSEPERSEQRHLYVVSTEVGMRSVQCLTCHMLEYHDTTGTLKLAYTHFDAHFSDANMPGSAYLVLESQGPFVPRMDVFAWLEGQRDDGSDGDYTTNEAGPYVFLDHQHTINTNAAIAQRVAAVGPRMPQVVYTRFAVRQARQVRIRLVVPASFRADDGRRYPLLVHAKHRAPGTYAGTSEFAVDWMTWMVATCDIVVAQIDGMGSSRQDSVDMYAVYTQVGEFESFDISRTVKWLINGWGHVDEFHVGIWGRGFGAYVTGRSLSIPKSRTAPNQFRCAALVSPMHEWMQINAFYAERYMNYPDEPNNLIGYQMGDLNVAPWLGLSLLLVHARAHELWDKLASEDLQLHMEQNGLNFDAMVYPNVSDAMLRRRRHVDRRLSEFFHRCLVDYCYF